MSKFEASALGTQLYGQLPLKAQFVYRISYCELRYTTNSIHNAGTKIKEGPFLTPNWSLANSENKRLPLVKVEDRIVWLNTSNIRSRTELPRYCFKMPSLTEYILQLIKTLTYDREPGFMDFCVVVEGRLLLFVGVPLPDRFTPGWLDDEDLKFKFISSSRI